MAIKYYFLDSGAFSLTTRAAEFCKAHNCDDWKWYRSFEMRAYLDEYARFVKRHSNEIDLYANVDAIGNAELTWRNQRYLEHEHGLTPIPVVHYGSDLKWLRHYMDKGYDMIGLGGLVGKLSKANCKHWIDRCFNIVCDNQERLPKVKLHGFGVTQYEAMIRYPWFSVDSSSWIQIAMFGGILVPHKRKGEFVFDEQPYIMKFSNDSPQKDNKGCHYNNLSKGLKEILRDWLVEINTKLEDPKDEYKGVLNSYGDRARANILFFERMAASLPKWPWPFEVPVEWGFAI